MLQTQIQVHLIPTSKSRYSSQIPKSSLAIYKKNHVVLSSMSMFFPVLYQISQGEIDLEQRQHWTDAWWIHSSMWFPHHLSAWGFISRGPKKRDAHRTSKWLINPIGSMVLLYMVAWIPSIYPQCYYIYQHHGSYGHVNINTVSRTLSPPRARRTGVVATYCNHLGVSLALLRRGLLALEWLGLGEGGRMWHGDGSKPIQDYIWIYLKGIKFINPS